MSDQYSGIGDEEEIPSSRIKKPIKGKILVGVIVVAGVLLAVVLTLLVVYIYEGEKNANADDSSGANNSTSSKLQICAQIPQAKQVYRGQEIYPIPGDIVADMIANHTWHEGCPVPISELTLLEIPYWNCEKLTIETGQLIVHVNVSNHVLEIFEVLLRYGFPIYKMRLMSEYNGDDEASMLDNNTSSFNCRKITGDASSWSSHSYGKAIDVNPYINPYVYKSQILPEGADYYADRSVVIPGTIIGPGGICYESFTKYGWSWGGEWISKQDYQHFEIL